MHIIGGKYCWLGDYMLPATYHLLPEAEKRPLTHLNGNHHLGECWQAMRQKSCGLQAFTFSLILHQIMYCRFAVVDSYNLEFIEKNKSKSALDLNI